MSKTYFSERMQEINFDPDQDTAIADYHPDEPHGSKINVPLFSELENGDIAIHLMNLSGELIMTDVKKNTKSRIQYEPLYYIRKHPKNNGAKYKGLPGMGSWPYITKTIVEAYQNQQKTETLYITEGHFKAFVMAKNGLPAIGIPGITVWKEKTKVQVFDMIRIFIKACNVKRVVYISDADTFDISYEEDKDLALRPQTFYNSIKIFKKLFTDYKCDLVWKAINPDKGLGKGIDDVLNAASKVAFTEIMKEIRLQSVPSNYFETYLVSAMTYKGLLELFCLDSAKRFYNRYQTQIEDNPFIWKRSKYRWSDEKADLVKEKSEFAAMLLMIGRTMYQRGAKPTRSGNSENVLNPITDKQLLKITGSKKLSESVFFEMDYFDGAINIPSHKDYEEFIETEDVWGNQMRWYNMYRRVTHQIEPGDITNSLAMIKHIFGEELLEWRGVEFPAYELGLDYVKLLWERPKTPLPILTLYSEERQTGKTTFWDWMRSIFQQNAKQVFPEHLTGQFTSHFANSLLVTVDEAIIEKKATMERIKGLVTSKHFTLEAKYSNAEEIENYIKVGLATNNRYFANIDEEEVRFWVRTISSIDAENFNMLEDLVSEIPAFLHYIESREMTIRTMESRAWFPPDLLQTDILADIKKQSKWRIEKEMDDALENHFAITRVPAIGLSSLDMRDLVGNKKYTGAEFRNVIEQRMKKSKKPHSVRYIRYDVNYEGHVTETQKSGMPYWFFINEFFTCGQILMILDHQGLKDLETLHNQDFWDPEKVTLDNLRKSDILTEVKVTDQQVKKALIGSKKYSHFVQRLEKKAVRTGKVSGEEQLPF